MEIKKNKTAVITVAVIVTITLLAGAYLLYEKVIHKNNNEVTSEAVYTCPMHPQIISDRPGQCPICGMDLVKETEVEKVDNTDGNEMSGVDLNSVKLSPSQQVLANVQTAKVESMQFSGEKTFNGYVKINETKFSHISTAISGKIVNMFISFEGQFVSKGEKVLEIYSPELVSTQKEYLLAIANLNRVKSSGNNLAIEQAQSLADASRERLILWEMTDEQINELVETGVVQTTTIQYSKYSGIVTKKYVHVGHWATAGEDIYDVADLSNVWVVANIYESDMQYIRKGQTAEIFSSAYPDEIIRAKINFINPVFNPDSRTMEVRIDVSNRNLKLKPDMFVKVRINTYASQTIAVPKNSVIRTGEGNIVYVEKEKGIYEPRKVQIGYEQNGYYAVTAGLNEGETIVTSGGFLIDSETQIQNGMKSGHENHQSGSGTGNEEGIKINEGQDIMKDMNEKQNIQEHKH